MLVISDASPVTNLIQVKKLSLLNQLFGQIIITTAVYNELCEIAVQKQIIDNESWIKVVELPDREILNKLLERLDKGEAESIALAIYLHADFLLIDETIGRTIAENMGLKIVGLLGILIKAKAEGIIPLVKPLVDDLIFKAGFYIHKDLYNKVIHLSNEI
jgi:predicted nucleic acid-binding protein